MTSSSSNNGFSTIFVGSSWDLQGLADSSIADPLIADGDVSFYGHMDGLVRSNQQGYENSIISKWAGTGSGVTELGYDEPMAIMSVTIENTSSTAIVLPIGQIVSSASGVEYQIVQKPRQETGWSNATSGSGSAGYYTINPGQSLTLMTQALVDGPSGNLGDNQVTQINVPGAQITASTLITNVNSWAAGTVTLSNSSTTDQVIWERMYVTGSGGAYQIAVDSTIPGFVATDADSSSGYYILKAGATITVPIASVAPITATTPDGIVQQEEQTTAAANSITSNGNLPSGVQVIASSALTLTGVSNPSQQGTTDILGTNSGLLTDAVTGYFTSAVGYNPTEADVNTYNDNIWTAQDLSNWKSYVDSARSVGYLNLAPMMSEFETVDFATSAATEYARAGALYSGGIAFDMPGWFFLARDDAYRSSVEAEIKWATANGLRSSITISPISGDDNNFLADTKAMVAMLQAAGALPTQFTVKDEGVMGGSVMYSATNPNSLNNVANYLAQLKLAPSNSESGLEVQGSSARPDDLMTGVAPEVVVLGGATVIPFSLAQIFAESKSNQATLTVTLSDGSLGQFRQSSSIGDISDNGQTYVLTGDMSDLTQGLSTLGFAATQNSAGTETVSIVITDNAGTIAGSTAMSVNNLLSLSGLPASQTTVGFQFLDAGIQVVSSSPSEILTATASLADTSLGEYWNYAGGTLSADGATLTYSGTASAIQTFLAGLRFISSPGVIGTETQTITLSDGSQTTSAVTNVSIANPVGIAVKGVSVIDDVMTGSVDTPYANILVTKASAPTATLSVVVSLSQAGAKLSPGSVGALSADGLTYTFNGNVSQIQAALRALVVDVPAGTTATSELLTLNLNGHVTQTTIRNHTSAPNFDLSITGAPQTITVGGGMAVGLYAGTQISTSNASGNVTAVVALTDSSLGRLHTSGVGEVSADGSTVTITGSLASVNAAISSVSYSAAALSSGTSTVNLTIMDASGKMTTASSMNIYNRPLPLSLSALPGNPGNTSVSLAIASASPLVPTAGGTISDGVFTTSGSGSAVGAALSGLMQGGVSNTGAGVAVSVSGSGMYIVDSGVGNDTITSTGGNLIRTGAGATIQAGRWDTISAGSGSVNASSNSPFFFLGGSSGYDTVTSAGGDLYGGGGGHSTLVGQAQLVGLHAGGANDTLIGGGQSIMYAATGQNTTIRLTSGDTAVGLDSANITGPASGTNLTNIFLVGGSETVTGGGGNMTIHENMGSNKINLAGGQATIFGSLASDVVQVGKGSTVQIVHGAGVETIDMTYGLSDGAQVTLSSFNPVVDQLNLAGYGVKNIQAALGSQSVTSAGTTLHLADGSTILFGGLAHVAATDITFS